MATVSRFVIFIVLLDASIAGVPVKIINCFVAVNRFRNMNLVSSDLLTVGKIDFHYSFQILCLLMLFVYTYAVARLQLALPIIDSNEKSNGTQKGLVCCFFSVEK